MMNMPTPFLVGVTGGIGSGKSAVCTILADFGAEIFIADDVAKHLMSTDMRIRSKLIDAFGDESFTETGELNARYLASLVFQSDDSVANINSIVHPAVREAFRKRVEATTAPILVIESALLVDSPYLEILDAIIVVSADEVIRTERVAIRDSSDATTVSERIKHQPSDETYRSIATFVVENSGTLADLRTSVREIVTTFPIPGERL